MLHSNMPRLACLAALVLAASGAKATDWATATMSDLQIQVISLAPGGGTISAQSGDVETVLFNGTGSPTQTTYTGSIGLPLTVSVGTPALSSIATTTTGDANSPGSGPGAYSYTSATAGSNFSESYANPINGTVTIGAYTEILVNATPLNLEISPSDGFESDDANATLSFTAIDGTPLAFDQSDIKSFEGVVTSRLEGSLSIYLVNNTPASESVFAFAGSYASARSMTPPVPEPSTYLLSLFGIAGLAFRCYKRKD